MVFIFFFVLTFLFIYHRSILWTPDRANYLPINKTIKIGHRGAPNLAKENTIDSFIKAFENGLEGVELDVQLSKDKKLIVFHDWTIETISGRQAINELFYSELQNISNRNNTNIPLLHEVFEILPEKCFVNIEIKSKHFYSTGIEESIIQLIHKYDLHNYVMISSFNPIILYRIKKYRSNILTAFLWSMKNNALLFNTPLWVWFCCPDGIHININYKEHRIVAWAKKKNMTILAYTVNNLSDYEWAKSIKLDGVFTDNPKL